MQVYAANLSSIQQNMQKDAARPVCVELLWHLRRKKQKTNPNNTCWYFPQEKDLFLCLSSVSKSNFFFSKLNPSEAYFYIFFSKTDACHQNIFDVC